MNTISEKINLNNTTLVYPYNLPQLPYAYDALEPYIDKLTMEIHHGRHHAAYINNLNNALKDSEHASRNLLELLRTAGKISPVIRNNGGGHFNHAFFWESLTANSTKGPLKKLLSKIETDFGSFENFKHEFSDAAAKRFGSGWAWLSMTEDKKLFVSSTPNQDNPLMDVAEKQGLPLLGIDVWEHAYYLKYQNKRPDYINAFWEVVNWDVVESRFVNNN
jgi:superoxide dismutase, Fe-Mn family